MTLSEAFRSQSRSCANLGSPFMARLFDLLADRLRPGNPVADHLLNWRGDISPTGHSLPLRLAGALHRLLAPFATHGVNLTSIQQRPLTGKHWEYVFFIDFEGHQSEERVERALAEAKDVAHSYRVLGSFPRAAALRTFVSISMRRASRPTNISSSGRQWSPPTQRQFRRRATSSSIV